MEKAAELTGLGSDCGILLPDRMGGEGAGGLSAGRKVEVRRGAVHSGVTSGRWPARAELQGVGQTVRDRGWF